MYDFSQVTSQYFSSPTAKQIYTHLEIYLCFLYITLVNQFNQIMFSYGNKSQLPKKIMMP